MLITVNFGSGATGLTNVGYTVLEAVYPLGITPYQARTELGVEELEPGLYGVSEDYENTLAGRTVIWDTNTGRYATESFMPAASGGGSTLTAQQVWEYATRTLTSAGAGGATAEEVWEYATRTLTEGGGSGGASLAEIEASTILAKQAKLDTLESRLTAARATAIDTITTNTTSSTNGVNTLLSRLSATRAAYLDNLATTTTTAIMSAITDMRGYWTNSRASMIDNLDTTVSSRASTSALNSVRDTILSGLSGLASAASLSLLLDRLSAVRAAKLDNLDRLDTTVSSRPTVTAISDAVQTIVDAASVEGDLSAIATDVALTRKILTNKQDDDGTEVKIYEDDDVTLIGIWTWDEGAGLRGKLAPPEDE